MPDAEHLGRYFELFSLILYGLLALRLAISGLWRSYPVFFVYIILEVPHNLLPLFLPPTSKTYLHVWVYSEWMFYVFHVLLVVEICRLILAGHPGIYSLGKWAIYAGAAIAVVFSMLSLNPHFTPRTSADSKIFIYCLAAGRGIDFALGIFLVLMLAFMSRYPFRLSRNVIIHVSLYTFYFFAGSLDAFLRTLLGTSQMHLDQMHLLNLLMSVVSCACLAAWLFLLSPKGEQVLAAFPTFSAARETQILEQLNALNATLVRAGRRK